MIWHSSTKEDVLNHYSVDAAFGLANGAAAEKQEIYGKNIITEGEKTSLIKRFFAEFNKTGILLIFLSLVYFFVANSYDSKTAYFGLLVIALVIVNAIISAFHLFDCENTLTDIKHTTNPSVRVLRDGMVKTINSVELVPGDIMLLSEGDYICADARLIETVEFRCNEVALSGEEIPIDKNASLVLDDIVPSDKRANMVFASTTAIHGSAKAVVVATGINTEVGKSVAINEQIGGSTMPMQNELSIISKLFNILILCVSFLVFAITMIQNFNTTEPFAVVTLTALLNAVALAVAAMPEGLNAISTIVIATGIKRILGEKIIFKDSNALETIGKTNVICADKTGIFTQNKMVLEAVYDGKKVANLSSGYIDETSSAILSLAAACNTLENDTTEDAISTACLQYNFKGDAEISTLFPKLSVIPFDSHRKTMTIITIMNEQPVAIIKGAPEIVVPNCIDCDVEGILKVNDEMASDGLRNVAIAIKRLDEIPANPKAEDVERGLTFAGILGLSEPVREEIYKDIKTCSDAKIKVVMLTGDNLQTAVSLAKQIGLLTDEAQAITGAQLDELSDDELQDVIENYCVFARISPMHKVRIVKAWQAKKAVVTITGDSLQDAEALAIADVGCAIGKFGADVAKGNANVIILKNNFGLIVRAIKESRGFFGNIKKTVKYLCSCNLGELLLLLIGSIAFKSPILIAVQLLLINLLTDCAPAISFSMEEAEKSVMKAKTLTNENKLLNVKTFVKIGVQGTFIALISLISYIIGSFSSPLVATTMTFVTLGIAQLLHCFNSKLEGSVFKIEAFNNRFMNLSVFATAFIIVFLVFTPVGFVFGLTILKLWQFIVAFILALLIVPLCELFKYLYK
ncbi:MAG: cation-transporting P-type ATPase [Ruminococcaceae bacterium]|nr:cation-transporting P-type ATPase [Oscillospiraceae bacterium]